MPVRVHTCCVNAEDHGFTSTRSDVSRCVDVSAEMHVRTVACYQAFGVDGIEESPDSSVPQDHGWLDWFEAEVNVNRMTLGGADTATDEFESLLVVDRNHLGDLFCSNGDGFTSGSELRH